MPSLSFSTGKNPIPDLYGLLGKQTASMPQQTSPLNMGSLNMSPTQSQAAPFSAFSQPAAQITPQKAQSLQPQFNASSGSLPQSSGPQNQQSGLAGITQMFNTPQNQQYIQQQIDTLQKLGALQSQLAQANVPTPAELTLDPEIAQLQSAMSQNTPQQYLKDNPSLQQGGITEGQLERQTAQEGVPIQQALSQAIINKSFLAQQRQIQATNLGAQSTALTNQASLQQQIRQLTQFGGLPPDLVNTVLQRQLFPEYNTATDVYGQPIAYNKYNPGQNFPLGADVFGQSGGNGLNLPQRNNNPGDLRNPQTGQFQQFNSPEEGFAALKSDLLGKMTGATSTSLTATSSLLDFAKVYAPASDGNDPAGYAQKLSQQLGVPVTTPIGQLRGRLDEFAQAVAQNEGFTNQNQRAPIPPFLQTFSQTYKTTDGKQFAYIDAAKVPDKFATVAQAQAAQAGIPYLAETEVGKLKNIDVTQQNLKQLSSEVNSILKPGVLGRAYGLTVNNAQSFLQSNQDISAFKVYRDTAINTIQALAGGQGSGFRLNQAEVDTATSNLPQITDNLETAQKKLSLLQGFLGKWEGEILNQSNVSGGNQLPYQSQSSQSQQVNYQGRIYNVDSNGEMTPTS